MKKAYSFLFILFIFSFFQLSAQRFDWIELAGGIDRDYLVDMATYDKYVYVTGQYKGPATFGSTVLSGVYAGIFVVKYDTLGNFYWAKSIGDGIAREWHLYIKWDKGKYFLYDL